MTLEIGESDEKSSVYLNHWDIKAYKSVGAVEYLELTSISFNANLKTVHDTASR